MEENKIISKKYLNLKKIEEQVPVPGLICLSSDDVCGLIKNFNQIEEKIKEKISGITLTKGAYLNKQIQEIEQLIYESEWKENADDKILSLLEKVNNEDPLKYSYAVRSASSVEDLSENSFAGIYETVLNVKGVEETKEAIKKVYFSGYNRNAIIERLETGFLETGMSINVIIQRMVNSKIAGVAFSYDPVEQKDQTVIEYSQGLGDKVVSGEIIVNKITIDNHSGEIIVQAENNAWEQCDEVIQTLRKYIQTIAGIIEKNIDIEWAWDGENLWILQVRPITTIKKNKEDSSHEAVWHFEDLYGDEIQCMKIEDMPEYASYFRKKRKPLFDLAKKCKLNTATSKLLRMNKIGFQQKGNQEQLKNAFVQDDVVIDFNDNLRQIIIKRKNLIEELNNLFSDQYKINNVVLRDYIYGDKGFISFPTPKGVIVEYSNDGLMAINRGTATSEIIELVYDEKNEIFNIQNTNHIIDFTKTAKELGTHPIQVEWIITHKGEIYPIDFSFVKDDVLLQTNAGVNHISHGYTTGNILKINSNESLLQISIAPQVSMNSIPDVKDMGNFLEDIWKKIENQKEPLIIAVDKPYASLATLIPYVKGFIFESSSILCHLSILLREKNIPAIAIGEDFKQLKDNMFVEINTNSEKVLNAIK